MGEFRITNITISREAFAVFLAAFCVLAYIGLFTVLGWVKSWIEDR